MPQAEPASAPTETPLPSGPLSEKQMHKLAHYWKSAGWVHRTLSGALVRATRSALGRGVAKGVPNALKYQVRERVRTHAGDPVFRKAVCGGVNWRDIADRRDMQAFDAVLPDLVRAFHGEPGGTAIVVYAIQNRIFDEVCASLKSKS